MEEENKPRVKRATRKRSIKKKGTPKIEAEGNLNRLNSDAYEVSKFAESRHIDDHVYSEDQEFVKR